MTETSKQRAPITPWDRRELPALFAAEQCARRVGNYTWAEMRRSAPLGPPLATSAELCGKLRRGRHAHHHAGRRQVELEKLYLASGGIAGAGTLGEPVEEVRVS